MTVEGLPPHATNGLTPSRVAAALTVIVLVGALLRIVALGAGIPYSLGSDEHVLVERAVGMMRSGDFHPHFFDYPTLYIYVQVLVAVARFLTGAIHGQWASLADAPFADFYLWGRAATAAIGTATILLAWLTLRRISASAALVGALFVAVLPMHVRESRYVLTDVPLTFFVLLTLLLSVRAAESPTRGRFAWAGAAAGLAAATKYTGVVAAIIPLVAWALTRGRASERVARALVTGAAAATAFLIAAPYTVLDLPAFLDGFAYLTRSYQGDADTASNAMTYLKHLQLTFGWPITMAAAAGLGVAAVRATVSTGGARTFWAASVIFTPVYFLFISRQPLVFGRYALPIVPVLVMLAAAVVGWILMHPALGRQPPRTRVTITAAVAALCILSPTITSIQFVRTAARPTTAALTYLWLLENAPARSRLAIEGAALIPSADRYRVVYERRLIDRSVEEYQAAGIDYLVASSTTFGGPMASDPPTPDGVAYRALFRALPLVAAFSPSGDRAGPEIRIYRVP